MLNHPIHGPTPPTLPYRILMVPHCSQIWNLPNNCRALSEQHDKCEDLFSSISYINIINLMRIQVDLHFYPAGRLRTSLELFYSCPLDRITEFRNCSNCSEKLRFSIFYLFRNYFQVIRRLSRWSNSRLINNSSKNRTLSRETKETLRQSKNFLNTWANP